MLTRVSTLNKVCGECVQDLITGFLAADEYMTVGCKADERSPNKLCYVNVRISYSYLIPTLCNRIHRITNTSTRSNSENVQ